MFIYVSAMSKSKKEIANAIEDRSDLIFINICKLLLYQHSAYCDHWKHEIYGFMPRMKKLKKTNKLPSKEFISSIMLDNLDGTVFQYVAEAIADEDDYNYDDSISDKVVQEVCEKYAIWLSEKLSTTGFVTHAEVKAKLSELMS
jgi:hypothetical protein